MAFLLSTILIAVLFTSKYRGLAFFYKASQF